MWNPPINCCGKTWKKAKNWGDGIIALNQSSETVKKQFGADTVSTLLSEKHTLHGW